jgi:uncharacterized protein (TIGR02597 family)
MTDSGTDLASSIIYYYYNGTANVGPGWRLSGGSATVLQNDVIVPPNSSLIVRLNVATNTTTTLVGSVPMSGFATPLSTLASNTTQDIAVGVSVPSNVTLSQSQLFESGAFAPSINFGATPPGRQDELLVFDNTSAQQDKAAFQIYYYYNGTANVGSGWRLSGGSATVLQNNTPVFQPGNGYVIRKAATASPTTVIWTFVPPYLTQ